MIGTLAINKNSWEKKIKKSHSVSLPSQVGLEKHTTHNTQEGVSHCDLCLFALIRNFKAKEELWKLLKYFTMQQNIIIFPKKNLNPLKETQNPSKYYYYYYYYYNSIITNLKFQQHKPKNIYHHDVSKILI
jgi:hypothetical protein